LKIVGSESYLPKDNERLIEFLQMNGIHVSGRKLIDPTKQLPDWIVLYEMIGHHPHFKSFVYFKYNDHVIGVGERGIEVSNTDRALDKVYVNHPDGKELEDMVVFICETSKKGVRVEAMSIIAIFLAEALGLPILIPGLGKKLRGVLNILFLLGNLKLPEDGTNFFHVFEHLTRAEITISSEHV